MLTDGIRGAMVVSRIWGSPCPSSFWTWNNTAQVSPGTPMLMPWVQHPPQTNMTPGSACAGLALPCQRPVSTAHPSRHGQSRSRAHQRVCRGQHGQPHVRTSRLHLLRLLDGKETTVSQGPVLPPAGKGGLLSLAGMRADPAAARTPHLVPWGGGRGVITDKERFRILQLLNARTRETGLGGNRLLPRALLFQGQIQPGASCQGWNPDPPPCEGPRGASSVRGTRRRLQPVGVRR